MSQRGSSPSSPAPKGWRAKLDKKKLADAGMSALVGGLKGAKAVLDTTAIPGASAVFSVILACIDDAQVRLISYFFLSVTDSYRLAESIQKCGYSAGRPGTSRGHP